MKKYILLSGICILMMSVAFVSAKRGAKGGHFDTERFTINDFAKTNVPTTVMEVQEHNDNKNGSANPETGRFPTKNYMKNSQLGKTIR